MTGRGRGALLIEFLKEANDVKNLQPGTRSDHHQKSMTISPLMSALAMKQCKPVMGTGGRGLMSPSQFVKGSSQHKEVNCNTDVDKTSAFIAAEQYLKHYSPYSEDGDNPGELNEVKSVKPVKMPSRKIVPQPQHTEPPKQTTPQLSQQEKEEAEGEWQKYKFQRQIATILGDVTVVDVDKIFDVLKIKLDASLLSQKYPQFNELQLILECLVEKSTKSEEFIDVSQMLIKKVADYDGLQFEVQFGPLISSKISELVRVSASDKLITAGARRFCQFLGAVYRSSLEPDNERLRSVTISCIEECIEKWTYPDGIGSEVEGFSIIKAQTHAFAATELFKKIELQNLDKERLQTILNDFRRIVELLKETVLNECLPRNVREIFLNLLLTYIPRWQIPNQDSSNDLRLDTDVGHTDSTFDTDTDAETASLASAQSTGQSEENNRPRNPALPESSNGDEESITVAFNAGDSLSVDLSVNSSSQDGDDAVDTDDDVLIEDEDAKSNEDNEEQEEVGKESNVEGAVDGFHVGLEHQGSDESACSDEKIVGKGEYCEIEGMMKELRLEDEFYRFKQNVIRDTVLRADQETLRGILKEASFPAGIIYEILNYLDIKVGPKRPESNDKKKYSSPYRKGPSKGYNTAQFRSQGSSFEARRPQGWAGFSTESPSNKKLFGIGRGSGAQDKQPTSRGQKSWHDSRNRTTDNWRRHDTGTTGMSSRNREEPWRAKASDSDKEIPSAVTSNTVRGVRTERYTELGFGNDVQAVPRVGKVEPRPRYSSGEKAEVKATKPDSFISFSSGALNCYRCGSSEHRSDECRDLKALFME